MFYVKWDIPPENKQRRRLQLASKLWSDPLNMQKCGLLPTKLKVSESSFQAKSYEHFSEVASQLHVSARRSSSQEITCLPPCWAAQRRAYLSDVKVHFSLIKLGKTTLANEVYNDACIRSHFDVCAWATISQQHNVKEILLSLLRSTKSDSFDMNDEAELANMLQKSLKGKRYLIVLDDMWKRMP
ncbi:hypothetical protein T459_24423 [Capsicum annuum]|uniref:NB-ARC domain-containing protein n=1 Tax=Capsicum annuum TaxID=4072 RepID=A0A2G2YV37_CAPAN|nr:hypothetical protein T459_24423 [Capsicum annuum]